MTKVEAAASIGLVVGKIEEVKALDRGFVTRFVLPAVDEYSSPSRCEVFSDKRLGQAGESMNVNVRIAGYREQVRAKDGTPFWKYHNRLFAQV